MTFPAKRRGAAFSWLRGTVRPTHRAYLGVVDAAIWHVSMMMLNRRDSGARVLGLSIIIGLVTAVVIVWSHLIAQKDDIIVALQCNKRSGLLSVMQQSRNSQSAEP
jgi:hypothetical protein